MHNHMMQEDIQFSLIHLPIFIIHKAPRNGGSCLPLVHHSGLQTLFVMYCNNAVCLNMLPIKCIILPLLSRVIGVPQG